VTRLSERLRALADLVPPGAPGRVIVDVGADHGHLAAALGAIAVERDAGRPGVGTRTPWVLADGLAPFRHVDVAVLAGLGARTIAAVLRRGPRPDVVVAQAPDDPPRLRRLLAADGWRVDTETLARERHRIVEITRFVPGTETTPEPWLGLGPRLLTLHHPLRDAWMTQERTRRERLLNDLGDHDPRRAETVRAELDALTRVSGRPS
jgi:tRNA A22 N-methylase